MHEHEFSLVIASCSIATFKATTLAWAVLSSRSSCAGYLLVGQRHDVGWRGFKRLPSKLRMDPLYSVSIRPCSWPLGMDNRGQLHRKMPCISAVF